MRIKDKPKVDRPREKMAQYGPEKLSDAELLAIILGSGTKKENVLNLSAKILRKINPRDVKLEELEEISGIGKAKACQILACITLGKRLTNNPIRVLSPEDIYTSLPELKGSKKECLIAFYLDTRNSEIARETISVGTLNANLVHPREVFEPAIKYLAAGIIIAHNHPSGDPIPSNEDIKLTKQLVEAGKILGIGLTDHIIIGQDKFVSLKEQGIV